MSSSNNTNRPLRIKIEKEIGRGAHSVVKFARDLDTFEPLAVKVIQLNESGREVYESELGLLRRLPDHRNVPKLFGHYETSAKGCLVLEYLPFPNLKEFVVAHGALSENQAAFILRQLVDVVTYMASQGVAHRDLKADNIIVNPDNLIIKIIDFGLGSELNGENDIDSTYRGTPVYMAPEVLREQPNYSVIPAELWSVGVIFWECLIGKQPFEAATTKRELSAMQNKVASMLTNELSENAKIMLSLLLNPTAKKRPTLSDAREQVHCLFDDVRRSDSRSGSRDSSKRERPGAFSVSRAKTFDNLRDLTPLGNNSPRNPKGAPMVSPVRGR